MLVVGLLICALHSPIIAADNKKDKKAGPAPAKNKKAQALAAFRRELPAKSEHFSFTSSDLDLLLDRELAKLGRQTAPIASDETFVRRTYLDLTGKVPDPDVVS